MEQNPAVDDTVVCEFILKWKETGNTQLKAGDHTSAIESYTKGIELANGGALRSQLFGNRAQVSLLLGKDEDAISDSELAIADDINNAKAYWRGASAAMHLQKYEVAKDFCERGLAIASDNTALLNLLKQADRQLAVRREDKPSGECPICLQSLDNGAAQVTLSCKHTFHQECVFELKSHGATQLCPICRAVGCRAVDIHSYKTIDHGLTLYIRSIAQNDMQGPADGTAAMDAAKIFQDILDADGDAVIAARVLGCLYDTGAGVTQNQAKACELWDRAAALGDERAQFLLGTRLDAGDGKLEDKAKALVLLEKAAAHDNSAAQVSLGIKYDKGDGVEENKAKALELWEKAAKHEHPAALYNLGLKYDTGDHVQKDKKKALEYWQRAVERGHAGAQFSVGARYNQGDCVPRDTVKAALLWDKAATQGHATAQYNLGIKYYTGDGLEKDVDRALILWELAAAQGNEDAKHNLSMMQDTED